ncbi:MAG: ABC transporter ATP-binding protein, partial [candidate division Zixibacteria bacterium]|nr:ABC transporter ATP-binding protein [candidate division Zixibacteria bacterium]
MENNNHAIYGEGLTRIFQRGSEKLYALKGVDFRISPGEIVSIVGRSGSGKTTLLNMVGCLDTLSEGTLYIGETEVSKLKEKDLIKVRRENIGFVFQLFYLIPTLTAYENALLPLLFARRLDKKSKVKEIFQKVGLGERLNMLPSELDGGDMQRIAIARALVNDPKIILADEPTGRLESRSKEKIFGLFKKLA